MSRAKKGAFLSDDKLLCRGAAPSVQAQHSKGAGGHRAWGGGIGRHLAIALQHGTGGGG